MDFPRNSYIALDEAGIEFNNRAYKTMPKHTIAWFKKHRHYGCDVDVFSQSWDDMDITIRRLANELWYMYKIGPFTLCRRVYKRLTIDKNTEQIIDGYRMANMLWIFVWFLQLGYPFQKKFMLTFRPSIIGILIVGKRMTYLYKNSLFLWKVNKGHRIRKLRPRLDRGRSF